MEKSSYIERIYRELSQRSSYDAAAHTTYLLQIFDHVKHLPSPEREEALVQMLLSRQSGLPNSDAPQAAA